MILIDIRKSNKLKDSEYSAFIKFDYNSKIVDAIRELPFRYYNPSETEWEVPTNKVEYLINKLKEFDIKICGKITIFEDKNTNIGLPEGFEFKTKPFSHQLEGVEYGLKYDRWFLGDEQGLGKTKQVIDIAVARKVMYGYRFCLIVCGVNTLKWNWVNEIHTHSKEDAYILGQRRKGTKIRIGSTKDKLEDLKLMYDRKEPHPYFIITNIESFRDKNIADTISDLCKKGIIGMCAADEMHKMKNPTAQQTKGFLKCLPYCRIGMTGTPLMNSPMDLYVILKWLGYESHAFYSFKQHYCVMGGYGGYEIVGYKNLDQLTAQVREIMLRRLKSEVLDLPEKIYVDDIVEMDGKQAVMYKEVEAGLKADYINGDIDLTNPLSALIRLRQTTGYPGILSDEITESAKLDRMEELVENCTSNDEKVIIFSNWTQMTDAICNKLKSSGHNVGVITGETPDSSRQEIVDVFQNSSDLSVLVGTIGAMGTGLTLTAATTVIFVDEPWNKALFDQAVDRAHRIGQKNNITIYSIMCKDTIDERIHNLIYKKGAMSDAIIDGKVVGNKNEVFDYLLNG